MYESSSDGQPVYHALATLLPFGESARDLWIVDGRITFTPRAGGRELVPPGAFVAAGLVDCHTHLHFVPDPRARRGRSVVDENRLRHLEAGTLLVRDLGSTSDDVLNLPDDDGLPVVHAAGQSLLVEERFPFFATGAGELPAAVEAQSRAGARWIKLFADWPGWPGKQEEPNFGGNDPVTYSRVALTEAVRAAHGCGARMAVHAFGREAAADGIAAGVDSIEHGWGLDEAMLDGMAGQGIAWTPLVGIAPHMLRGAEGRGDREQAAWIRAALTRLKTLIPLADKLGVTILAGTDWFPFVTLADDVSLLHAQGLTPATALAAATSTARRFLGEPDIVEGARADLVFYRADPRENLSTLTAPDVVMLRGRVVRGGQV
jgi:imidazolonepropionase-like amidohydrolase